MGRQKKKRIRRNDFTVNDNLGVKKALSMLIVVLVVCAICLGIAKLIEYNKNKTTKEPSTIVENKIIAGSILNRDEDNYYVLATTSKDTNATQYDSALESYAKRPHALSIYKVDLDSFFSKSKMTGEYNLVVDDISKLTFGGSALLKISNGKVVEAYEQDKLLETIENLENLDA